MRADKDSRLLFMPLNECKIKRLGSNIQCVIHSDINKKTIGREKVIVFKLKYAKIPVISFLGAKEGKE